MRSLRAEVGRQERRTRQHLDEIRDAVRQVEHDLAGRIDDAADRLERRLLWFERHVRASAGARIADLDGSPDLSATAALAEWGAVAEAELLGGFDREQLLDQVAALDRWHHDHRRAVEATVSGSRAIAGSEPSAPDRADTVAAFRRAAAAERTLRQQQQEITDRAGDAGRALSADDEQRARCAAVIEDGKPAWTKLRLRIRTRIGEMLDRAEMPPAWFATVLGPGPPAEADGWMETGTDLVAYRITYGVTDPAVALGERPGDGSSARRRRWYGELSVSLQRHGWS